jgi:NRPS condensation-like uncharacterized protein
MHLLPAQDGYLENSASAVNAVFPLPLSDFEYYMLLDDRPSHPMVFVMVIDVSGSLHADAFQDAVKELLRSHPLLNCRVEKLADKGWCWIPLPADPSVVEWTNATDDAVKSFVPAVRSIDVRTKPGLRLGVIAGPSNARIALSLHHACCDGLASLQIVGELLARYGQKTAAPGEKVPEFQSADSYKLLQRENYETGEAAAQRQKRSLGRIVGKVSRLLLRSPVMLADSADLLRHSGQPAGTRHSATGAGEVTSRHRQEQTHAAIHSAVLTKATHRALRAVAAQQNVSINDLFVREMMLQIRNWNRRGGLRFGRRWIRIAMPLSMRTIMHENMSAANVVSYALITRREVDCENPSALLNSIHEQTSDVLYNREGIVCLKLFRILRKIPGAMKAFLSFKTVLSTLVLANVGDVRRRFNGRFPLSKGKWLAGNVLVEQIHGVAPVRPNTRASMSIGDYAGELSISLRTDGHVLNDDHSKEFLSEFVCRLQDLVGTAAVSATDEDMAQTERPGSGNPDSDAH